MIRPLLMMLLVALLPPVLAFEDPYDKYRYNREEEFDYDETLRKPWQEESSGIPAMPEAKAMKALPIDGLGEDFDVFIDPASLSVGEDQVVRYWLMLRSRLGAVNWHYEGIRCGTREYKTYAFGSKSEQSGYRVVKEPQWASVTAVRGRGFRHELYAIFCDYGLPRAKRDIFNRVRDMERGLGSGRESSGPNAFF